MNEPRADTFLRLIRRSERGKLKIYLGYCAGVGKTYQMLREAHRLKEEGIDVVVGLVETHGREETAKLLNGLEIIARRKIIYHGIEVGEMDSDAILARHPGVVLIDELAHTNVPGSKNTKRYQDVEDILSAGIHVISTLNIQHLESLYDTVEGMLGVRVRERIPDKIVAEADQLVNTDITTEDLRRRLEEGRIYPRERIETAMSNFFETANLEQLRELTLRELAAQIDARRRNPLEQEVPAAPDQVMVCLSSRGPNSGMLLRYASRLAGRLNRNWYAVYVRTSSESPEIIDAHTHRLISETLTLAKQLGAMVFTYKGENIADTILRFAKEYRVGHIVIGSPGRKETFWQKLTGKTDVVRQLIEKAEGMTIVVLDTRKAYENMKCEERSANGSQQPSDNSLMLTRLLSATRILLWETPVDKDDAIEQLVRAVCREFPHLDAEEVLKIVRARELRGSTFSNEGAAFPHARLERLTHPILAMGIARQGLGEPAGMIPCEVVFLILTPANPPETQVRILAKVSGIARNHTLMSEIVSSETPKQVHDLLCQWE